MRKWTIVSICYRWIGNILLDKLVRTSTVKLAIIEEQSDAERSNISRSFSFLLIPCQVVAQRPVFDILGELAGTQKLIVDKWELPLLTERMCECVTVVSEEMCPFGRTMMKKCAHPSASTPSNGAWNYCQINIHRWSCVLQCMIWKYSRKKKMFLSEQSHSRNKKAEEGRIVWTNPYLRTHPTWPYKPSIDEPLSRFRYANNIMGKMGGSRVHSLLQGDPSTRINWPMA